MKKLITILLVLVFVMSFAVTALADPEVPGETTPPVYPGSITIEKITNANDLPDENYNIGHQDPVSGQTYTIYRILDLSFDATNNAYTYTVSPKWTAFFETGAPGLTYMDIDEQGYVTWKTGQKAADLAQAAIAFARQHNIANDGQQTAADSALTFTNLQLGYYLVESTYGALCSLDTTNPDVTIHEKNEIPSIDKVILEGSGVKVNDVSIGDYIHYQTTITAQPGAVNYVLHDTMDAGLSFVNDNNHPVVVKVGNTTLTPGTDYNVVTDNIDTDTFQIVFTPAYLNTITAKDTQIVVTYWAQLNANAVIANEHENVGNNNKTQLSYGDNKWTEQSTTKTYTWEIDVFKYTEKNEQQVPLAGAEFVILRDVPETQGAKQVALFSDGKVTGWDAYDEANIPDAAKFVTDSTGYYHIKGLDAGTYYLHETKAPDGYNKATADITFVMGSEEPTPANGTLNYKPGDGITTADGKNEVQVLNLAGNELPSTGGIGTTLFYLFGGLLAAGAAVVLVAKKRSEQ